VGVEPGYITIKGAREHNLRGVSLRLPRGRLICFTGVSGSGKSSLAFDTLFAEGQRRYVESLSSYARQFLGQLPKPDVDQMTGLSPSIAIQQKSAGWNPRSTVGTITQIHDYLRVMFARVGRQHCPNCSRPISAQTRDQMIARIAQLPGGTRILVLAPVVRGQKGEYRDLFEDMRRQGFARARVDGEVVSLSDPPALARNIRHDIEIVVDRIALSDGARPRLAEALETALRLGEGTAIVQPMEEAPRDRSGEADEGPAKGRSAGKRSAARAGRARKGTGDLLLSSSYACAPCGLSFEPPSPQLFSFNSPTGMCLSCDGLGTRVDFDPDLLVPDARRSFLGLAVEPMRTRIGRWRRHVYEAVAQHVGFDLKAPWKVLPERAREALLFGLGDTHLTYEWRWSGGVWRHGGPFAGVVAELRDKYRKAGSPMVRAYYEKYMRKTVCPSCGGGRLNLQATAVRLGDRNINEVCAMSIDETASFFDGLELTATERFIATDALREIRGRLRFLQDVGLGYLSLERTAPTLAGGEAQRIRLASQIGAGLVGVLYILDEPSIGLHARDNRRLLDSLIRLRDQGNTVIVVEHDEETMRTADHVVDFGPGPGVRGGQVVAQGNLAAITRAKGSITGRYLRGEEKIEVPARRRPVSVGDAPRPSRRAPRGKPPKQATVPRKRRTIEGARRRA
jgi:excinuclease ABC subunit A